MLYRIRDWSRHFENNRSRELKKIDWVPIPNKHDGDGFTDLISRPNGVALFGAWILILQVASKCDPRGTLYRQLPAGGCGIVPVPHDAASLARITRCPENILREALKACSEIGWIESIQQDAEDLVTIPQEGAGKCGADARARSVPFPSLPLDVVLSSENLSTEEKSSTRARFDSFLAASQEVGMSGSESDFDEARAIWAKLNFNDQLSAVRGLFIRHQAGEFDDAKFIPLPQNYLGKKIWAREVRPRAAPVKTKTDRAMDIFERRMAERISESQKGVA